MHVRIMTWFPMKVQICLNGREWLARQLDAAGIRYERRDNSFAQVSDFARAQALLEEQVRTDWPTTLSELLREVHPEFEKLRADRELRDYYWTAEQTEVATDVAFRSEAVLEAAVSTSVASRHREPVAMRTRISGFCSSVRRSPGRTIDGRFRGARW